MKNPIIRGGKMNNKRLAISLTANIIAFSVNMAISFCLTPYIVKHVGSEAYGFVSLANNFTSYATVLTIALNSMTGRFITIEYENNRMNEVQQYFSSALFANICMCGVLLIPSIVCVFFLESILNISPEILNDVKILFGFIFAGFFVTLINATYSTSLFVTNRKDVEARRNIESYLIKAIILILAYIFFKPAVYYVGVATLVTALYSLFANIYFTKKYLPNVDIKYSLISKEKIAILITSGIWNSLTKLSNVLTDGLDLLITNLFISSAMMGTLSIAKMIPSVVTTLVGTIAGVFVPNYTIAYAHEDKNEFIIKIRQSIVISSVISNVCLTALIALGTEFFALWVPGQDKYVLYTLSVLTIAGMSINGGMQCVYNIFAVVNKIKINSLVNLVSDLGIVGVVFICLKTTNLGVYAVAGVSSIVIFCRSLLFSIPYAAHCSGIKMWFFYKQVVINLLALVLSTGVVITCKNYFHVESWMQLVFVGAFSCIIALIINLMVITNKNEKTSIIKILKRRIF